MDKLYKLFKSMFVTPLGYTFVYDERYKDNLSYVFSACVIDIKTGDMTNFACFVQRCSDNTGIGLAAYYEEYGELDAFYDFKVIEL